MVAQNFITEDTEAIQARISQQSIEAAVKLAKDASEEEKAKEKEPAKDKDKGQ